MEIEAFRRLEEVFEQVAPLPPVERAATLARLCGEDVDLLREVEALLAADAGAGDFLLTPLSPWPAPLPLPGAGHRLGAYKIVQPIGAGGMGAVFLAERDDREYERRVAIKVLRAEADREGLRRRFRAERQILATLDHPGIARLLDGGTTPEGLPYLVMEYIEGSRSTAGATSGSSAWRRGSTSSWRSVPRSPTPIGTWWCTATSNPRTSW